MMDGWGTLYKWLVAVILCGGLVGWFTWFKLQDASFGCMQCAGCLEIVKTLNLIDSTWLYQGKRTKLCCHIACGFVEKPLFFEKSFPPIILAATRRGGVESKGSSPVGSVEPPSPSWWRWTVFKPKHVMSSLVGPWIINDVISRWYFGSSRDGKNLPKDLVEFVSFLGCESSRHAIELIYLGKL